MHCHLVEIERRGGPLTQLKSVSLVCVKSVNHPPRFFVLLSVLKRIVFYSPAIVHVSVLLSSFQFKHLNTNKKFVTIFSLKNPKHFK